MNSAAWIFAFAVTFAPLVMRFIFLLAAIVLYFKIRTLPTAMIAFGVGLGVAASIFFRTTGPAVGVYAMYLYATASVLQTVGFFWFVWTLPKRQEQSTLVRADAQEVTRRST